jgi:sarcosine oxidase subunit alpha
MSGERRVVRHPALGFMPPPRPVEFTFAGRSLSGLEGDTITAALFAAGIRSVTLYCGIGHCYACHVTVDGIPGTRACLVPIRPGMRVEADPLGESSGED